MSNLSSKAKRPHGCKRQCILLETKLAIIRAVDAGNMKKSSIAQQFGIPATTLSTIIKNRSRIIEDLSAHGSSFQRKRIRTVAYNDVDVALYKWVRSVTARKGKVTNSQLKSKAFQLARSLGHREFSGLNGWFERFKNRHRLTFKTSEDGEVHTNQPPKQAQFPSKENSDPSIISQNIQLEYAHQLLKNISSDGPLCAKLDQEIHKWAQQCNPSALDDEEEDDLQDTASALDDAELWAEEQRVAISALGEEIQNWSLQQQNSASLLETDIEQLSNAQQQSTSSLEKDLERWASRHSTPTKLGGSLHRWTTNQLHDVASSLDRDLEKWETLRYSAATNFDKWAPKPTAGSLDNDLEKWANLSPIDRNLEKWKRRRDRPVLSLTPEKWPSPHNVMSVSLDRDLEKWEEQQRENAASLERDLEKWVGECQQSALTRESDLEKWVTLHRKKTLFLEKEIDDWVDNRRHSMSLLEKEVDQWHRRHSSVSLLEREAKKNQNAQFRSYPDRPVGTLPRRDWKRVMRRRTFKETSV